MTIQLRTLLPHAPVITIRGDRDTGWTATATTTSGRDYEFRHAEWDSAVDGIQRMLAEEGPSE